ncbi:MAG: hypothetical protein KC776_36355 [Myxococcales bacterium]|nr:hypothetical protein [Myxococcales bacterium]
MWLRFDNLSATLVIELSKPTQPITDKLYNQRAVPSATITAIRLEAELFGEGLDDARPLTADELAQVAITEPQIFLRGFGDPVLHRAPNQTHFTLGDLLVAIEETERQTRHQSSWFGGIDIHHRFLEALERGDDGVWVIHWGS